VRFLFIVRSDFGSGLICLQAQTITELFYVNAAGRMPWRSNMHGLKCGSCRFWQRTDLPPGLKHTAPRLRGLRLGLQTRQGSNHSAAHVSESNSRSNVFQIPSRICLRAQPLKNSAGRVPQAAD